ncbi:hypothetical protein BC941DRAFT_412508 [Chlamydoabsidia padenii]|nr:hypothetical protein BC941DRAFT_412508 [Chlamydoabsidia padenii]
MLVDKDVKTTETEKTDEAHYANLFDRPEGLYLQGVDNMSTEDIENFCADTDLVKVEWINDGSCVLVYDSATNAQTAAQQLLMDPSMPLNSTDLQPAKTYHRPNETPTALSTFDSLQLRQATDSDVKVRNARYQSRYYLFHGSPRQTTSILDRLGARVPPERYQDSTSRYDRREAPRRRSLSPPASDKPLEIPDHLRGRLGNLN